MSKTEKKSPLTSRRFTVLWKEHEDSVAAEVGETEKTRGVYEVRHSRQGSTKILHFVVLCFPFTS